MWRPVFMAMVTAMALVFVLDFVLDQSNGFFTRSLAVFGFIGLQISLKVWNIHRFEKAKREALARVMERAFGVEPPTDKEM